MTDLIQSIEPQLWELVAIGLAAALTWIANRARVAFQGRIDDAMIERAQRTVHSAVMTALRAAIAEGKTRDEVLADVVEHVFGEGALDSAVRLRLSKRGVERLALSHMPDELRAAARG